MKFFVLLVALMFACTGCWELSTGERYGEIVKFSKKGAFFKTWEGEMILGGGATTATDQTFMFSVDAESKRGEDIESLARSISEAQKDGCRVELSYVQEMVIVPWRSETLYLIQSVTKE